MINKTVEFILKAFLFVVMFLVPTIILLVYYIIRYEVPKIISTAFLYLAPTIFIVLFFCVIRFISKKPCSLFVLPVGFLIALIFFPIGLSLLGMRNVIGGGFGGEGMEIVLVGALYSLPFIFVTLIIAFIMILMKKPNKP